MVKRFIAAVSASAIVYEMTVVDCALHLSMRRYRKMCMRSRVVKRSIAAASTSAIADAMTLFDSSGHGSVCDCSLVEVARQMVKR